MSGEVGFSMTKVSLIISCKACLLEVNNCIKYPMQRMNADKKVQKNRVQACLKLIGPPDSVTIAKPIKAFPGVPESKELSKNGLYKKLSKKLVPVLMPQWLCPELNNKLGINKIKVSIK